MTAAPCRSTRRVHALNTVISNAPTLIAEYRYPTAYAPPNCCASAGKIAIGIANVIARMSTAYVPSSSDLLAA